MESNQLNPKSFDWYLPQPFCSTSDALEKLYPLKVFNTQTKTKVRFIPQNPDFVTWYQCGPTVYAESHLGHARTYVSLDIIKRVLRDYFNYNVILCQNVTDIDDKIIIRSAENGEDFRSLASRYEIEFLDDMESLGVELPDMMTRVSEYVDEIKEFIKVIEKNGFAYQTEEGSVYFDVEAFQRAGYKYGKLSPESIGNSKALAEGEGALTASSAEKRSTADFALWKRTKDFVKEPSWPDEKYGPGRPGWHIECSVMATEAFKQFTQFNSTSSKNGTIDIHAGGVDLKFPHHDNEIAQSEAYLSSHRWVNYWLHTGHLHIDGAKMSKSLKNFTTIRAVLEVFSARVLRLFFLLHKYNAPLDYSEDGLRQASDIDKIFNEFFNNVKVELRSLGHIGKTRQHLEENDSLMFEYIRNAKMEIHQALSDDFDTPRAIVILKELIREYNKKSSNHRLSTVTVSSVLKTVQSLLRVFGMSQFYEQGGGAVGSGNGGENQSKEQILTPILNEVISFRQNIRKAAKELLKPPSPPSEDNGNGSGSNAPLKKDGGILSISDQVRSSFFKLGIRIEDIDENNSVWKLIDLVDVEKELKQKAAEEELKQQQRELAAKKAAEKLELSKISPNEMFLKQSDQYSEFDSEGFPVKDNDGKPLAEAKIKKLKKEQAAQEKLHQKYLESLTSTAK